MVHAVAVAGGFACVEPVLLVVTLLTAVGVRSRDEEDEVWGRRRPLLSQGCGLADFCPVVHVLCSESPWLACTPVAHDPAALSHAMPAINDVGAVQVAVSYVIKSVPVVVKQALNRAVRTWAAQLLRPIV